MSEPRQWYHSKGIKRKEKPKSGKRLKSALEECVRKKTGRREKTKGKTCNQNVLLPTQPYFHSIQVHTIQVHNEGISSFPFTGWTQQDGSYSVSQSSQNDFGIYVVSQSSQVDGSSFIGIQNLACKCSNRCHPGTICPSGSQS